MDRERAQEVGVHCACVEVGKGSKINNVIGGKDFFIQLEAVDVVPGLDGGRLYGSDGLSAVAVVHHVALISS